jgi:hypothetical protein
MQMWKWIGGIGAALIPSACLAAFAIFQTYTDPRVQKNIVTDYGATCNGVADDTAAFLAFKAAYQGTTPVQLNLPGFCTFLPVGGSPDQWPFKGISNLIVAGNGTATSGIKNIAPSGSMLFGGSGQYQDNAHSLRTNTANAGDSCVTIKTQPAVTVSNVTGSLAFASTFTASASGTTLTVTSAPTSPILPGMIIGNLDSNPGFFNKIQPYGTAGTTGVGGTGTYALSTSATFSSQTTNTAPTVFTGTVDANGVLTVSSIVNGTITVGAAVFSESGGIGGTGGTTSGITTIKSQLTGAAGSTGTYQLDNSPLSAISSPTTFQLQGKIRVTLNSTTGLSTGETLYLSGINGQGQLPQRANGLKWIKVIDATTIELFQWVFDGGYSSGGSGGGDRTSLTPIGSKVMMTGWINQAYWSAPYGFPSNPHWFEYKTVASTNSTTHEVCFDTPLANTYKSTWPQYNTGSLFEVDAGGPATLYLLDPTWELTHEYKDFTLNSPNAQTTANGRSITYRNILMAGAHCAIPTQNETHNWINVDASGCAIETDKIVGTWNLTNSSVNQVTVQSSSMNLINVSGLTANKWYGAGKRLVVADSSFNCSGCSAGTASLGTGTTAYGASDETVCNNCVVSGLLQFNTPIQRVDDATHPWSMSGGVITIPNAYSYSGCCNQTETQTRGLVPGHYVVWRASLQGRIFKVVDVTQDVDNTYVTTNEVGGFPTGSWSSSGLSVMPHPAPMLTMTSITGDATATSFNGCPAQSPQYSCQNFTYTGGASGGSTSGYRPILWGELSTFTFTNNVPYAGAGSLTWTVTQFGNWPALKTDLTVVNYGTSPNGQMVLNTKLPSSCGSCTRTLTSSGATNTQAGDTITVPPTNAWFGGNANSGPIFSADTPSDSPQVTMTLRTNQNLP